MNETPDIIPVFPLSGALLLPGGYLPLNIFEPRYMNMVDDALGNHRLIGMIQPKEETGNDLYNTGCIGRITSFMETEDNRYLVTLTGQTRFDHVKEEPCDNGYRKLKINIETYQCDMHECCEQEIDWDVLSSKLGDYFKIMGMETEVPMVGKYSFARLISMLCMVCPFEPSEKQALLEAKDFDTRYELFIRMLDIAIQSGQCCEGLKH